MNDQWPPPAPNVRKHFKKAHDHERGQQNTASDGTSSPVSKKMIEDMEAKRKKTSPQIEHTPFGTKKKTVLTAEQEKRLARMKESLKRQSGKARDDFGRAL